MFLVEQPLARLRAKISICWHRIPNLEICCTSQDFNLIHERFQNSSAEWLGLLPTSQKHPQFATSSQNLSMLRHFSTNQELWWDRLKFCCISHYQARVVVSKTWSCRASSSHRVSTAVSNCQASLGCLVECPTSLVKIRRIKKFQIYKPCQLNSIVYLVALRIFNLESWATGANFSDGGLPVKNVMLHTTWPPWDFGRSLATASSESPHSLGPCDRDKKKYWPRLVRTCFQFWRHCPLFLFVCCISQVATRVVVRLKLPKWRHLELYHEPRTLLLVICSASACLNKSVGPRKYHTTLFGQLISENKVLLHVAFSSSTHSSPINRNNRRASLYEGLRTPEQGFSHVPRFYFQIS